MCVCVCVCVCVCARVYICVYMYACEGEGEGDMVFWLGAVKGEDCTRNIRRRQYSLTRL
jgi:hypothetical protein